MQKASITEKQNMGRSSLVWVVSFVILVGFFYWLDQHPLFQKTVVDPLSVWTAKATVFILSLLGLSLSLDGTTVMGPSLRLEIAQSCSGSFVFLMFAAAVIPFPASLQSRLKGLSAGLVTLILVNVLRTSLIVLMVSRFPPKPLDFSHYCRPGDGYCRHDRAFPVVGKGGGRRISVPIVEKQPDCFSVPDFILCRIRSGLFSLWGISGKCIGNLH